MILGITGSLSSKSTRESRRLSRRTLVSSLSCNQASTLNISGWGLVFSSKLSSMSSFLRRGILSEEIVLFSETGDILR